MDKSLCTLKDGVILNLFRRWPYSIYAISVFTLQALIHPKGEFFYSVQVPFSKCKFLMPAFCWFWSIQMLSSVKDTQFLPLLGEPATWWNGWQVRNEDCQQCPGVLLADSVLQGNFAAKVLVWARAAGLSQHPSLRRDNWWPCCTVLGMQMSHHAACPACFLWNFNKYFIALPAFLPNVITKLLFFSCVRKPFLVWVRRYLCRKLPRSK